MVAASFHLVSHYKLFIVAYWLCTWHLALNWAWECLQWQPQEDSIEMAPRLSPKWPCLSCHGKQLGRLLYSVRCQGRHGDCEGLLLRRTSQGQVSMVTPILHISKQHLFGCPVTNHGRFICGWFRKVANNASWPMEILVCIKHKTVVGISMSWVKGHVNTGFKNGRAEFYKALN